MALRARFSNDSRPFSAIGSAVDSAQQNQELNLKFLLFEIVNLVLDAFNR